MGYWSNISSALSTTLVGASLTIRHFFGAIFKKRRKAAYVTDPDYFTSEVGMETLNFPHETLPIPDNGRYQLHNEIDDCIVCDKCAKVCPVNCIEIEPIKSVEPIGPTSDGTMKRIFAAKFDIDMAKCCFCGLCTTVCPTECLTMTPAYDFSVQDVREMIYQFSDMTAEEVLHRKKELADDQKAKEKAKQQAQSQKLSTTTTKPVFRPKIRPSAETTSPEPGADETAKKPVFRPKMSPSLKKEIQSEEGTGAEKASPKPVFKPKRPVIEKKEEIQEDKKQESEVNPTLKRPVFKPKSPASKKTDTPTEDGKSEDKPVAKKPVYKPKRPVMKKPPATEGGDADETSPEIPKD